MRDIVMNRPLVSIVIPTHNRKRLLKDSLLSIRKTIYRDFETIVVDAASTDGTDEMIRQEFPEVKLIRAGDIWHGESQNIGVVNSRGELIVSLEDDYIVEPMWLETLVRVVLSSEKIGIVGGRVNFYEDKGRILYAGGKIDFLTGNTAPPSTMNDRSSQDDLIKEVDYVPVILARRKVYADVGLWDPEYKLLFDETDVCFRAKKQGYKIVYVPGSIVWHKMGPTGLSSSIKRIYFLFRNRIRFIIKNFPIRYFVTALPYTILQILGLIIFFSIRGKPYHARALIMAIAWNMRNMRKTIVARKSFKTLDRGFLG